MIDYTDYEIQTRRRIISAGIASLVAYLVVALFNSAGTLEYSTEMKKASHLMAGALERIGEYRGSEEAGIDETIDPNRTGIIGPPLSELMTTVGHLEAKRTTTNPNMAGLMVYLMQRSGVARGDTIAIGCSASFPSLLIAVLCAADALEVHPVVIISLGASSYGATSPDFNLFDIYERLLEWEFIKSVPAAVSLGGGRDVGEEFDPASKVLLIQRIRSGNLPLIIEPDLQSNVTQRMRIYGSNNSSSEVSAFVNIGGGYANMGISSRVLQLKPGINNSVPMPPEEQKGVIHEMASRGIPVIHLLNIRNLIANYGLPWDPVPLPSLQSASLSIRHSGKGILFWLVTTLYLAVLTWLMTPIIRFDRRGPLHYYRT